MRTACALWLGGLLAATGCLDPAATRCDDGSVCPIDKVCIAGGCALPEQVTACSGAIEGDACTFAGSVGECQGGVCLGGLCGNGTVDPGELCDDSNHDSGDGCRADCNKIEQCGDGVLDQGEGCDDGNDNPGDGCDACAPTEWTANVLIGGGVVATTVGLYSPRGVAVDARGNLYIADWSHRIRRLDTSGAFTTIAGSGVQGYSGDGGPATSARIDTPSGIAVDGVGNVYIADRSNHCIRRVDTFGIITTVVGRCTQPGLSGDGGLATVATLNYPSDVAVDGLGDLYIADSSNHRVRMVDTAGIITTVAGTTQGSSGDGGPATAAQVEFPNTVALDGLGNLYIFQTNDERIRRVTPAGIITTLIGTGLPGFTPDGAVTAGFVASLDGGVEADSAGNVYFTDGFRMRRLTPSGMLTTLAGTGTFGFAGDGGPATSALLESGSSLARAPNGALYLTVGERVRKVDTANVISTVAGSGESGYSVEGRAATTADSTFSIRAGTDPAGNIYLAQSTPSMIRRVGADGLVRTIVGQSAGLFNPHIAIGDGQGNLFIADSANDIVRKMDSNGVITTVAGNGTTGFSGDGGPATSAQLNQPRGLAVDAQGNLYICDYSNLRVRRVSSTGVITTVAGNGTSGTLGDGGPATSARLGLPTDVALDGAGNLYILDDSYDRVRKVAPNGIITLFAGSTALGFGGDGGPATAAKLNNASGVAADAAGNVYIADTLNNRIRRVDTAGIITTIAGTGGTAFVGDGGPATSAQLDRPRSVSVDGQGRIVILDSWAIRRIVNGTITTVFGNIDPQGTGPLGEAVLSDPRALARLPAHTLFASGSAGIVQAAGGNPTWLTTVAGRHPQDTSTTNLARYRDASFGTVGGIAYDAAGGRVFITETSAHRVHAITLVNPTDTSTWTIATLANATGTAGFANGAAATARFREPGGLYFDPSGVLYVADTGNHVVRAIDLAGGVAAATVRTVAGTPVTLGYAGDGGPATSALLFAPGAITRCANGDLFVADTGNHRVRRIEATTGRISTVIGDGIGASSGEGSPASTFPVSQPRGLACDPSGNLLVTSSTTIRLLAANATGVVDGTGSVQTIFGSAPRDTFPASVTTCLTGVDIVDATHVQATDSCTGMLIELTRAAKAGP